MVLDWPASFPHDALAFVVGYALGSVPFGLLLMRLTGGPDIRAIGSGNIGATNVLRTGRKGLAGTTLLLDLLKGTVAVLLARYFLGGGAALAAGLGAFLGHLFPVWLRFRGGKGVATFIGILLAFAWPLAAAYAVIWLIVAALTRYSSLAGLIACTVTPALLWAYGRTDVALLFVVLAALVVFTHRANIARLATGREHRIGT